MFHQDLGDGVKRRSSCRERQRRVPLQAQLAAGSPRRQRQAVHGRKTQEALIQRPIFTNPSVRSSRAPEEFKRC